MTHQTRRQFIISLPILTLAVSGFRIDPARQTKGPMIMTVRGPIDPASIGNALIHEHVLVDFIGAKLINKERWNKDEVMDKVLPFLDEAKLAGCNTLVECTPNYLGRDVALLEKLSSTTGLNIITNTGYYGGSDNKFLPDHAFTETADTLANRWINEWKFGIDKTGIKPGFIKTSVNPGPLSDISRKLVRAAAITHLKTGLTIASHTGPAVPAMEQIEMLKKERISPSAFIWVHAQAETDNTQHVKAARDGAWVSLDGLNDENGDEGVNAYADRLEYLKKEKCLNRVLLSHDAGWYEPGKPGGGNFRGYTTLFKKLLPELKKRSFSDSEIKDLIHTNPKNAFTVAVRRLKGK
ncbi:MAG TPA: phosphotriesterase [Chryseosolibacter sp.]